MKYRIIFSIQALFLAFVLTACAGTAANENLGAGDGQSEENTGQETGSTQDQTDYFWQLNILNAEVAENLANTQTFILYGGSTEDVQYVKTASSGNTFLLLELEVDKNGVGGTPFSWSGVYVEDGDGNQYRRMENDVFLEDYDLPRLKSTDLTIGNNSGHICLEIPVDIDMTSLKLVHETEEGLNALPISIVQS